MSGTIGHRVKILQRGAAIIGSGNLNHSININGDDEFTELARAFDIMTAKLRESYANLEAENMVRKSAEETLSLKVNELAYANRELEAFSYSIAHDLRNPLNNILTLIEVLKKEAGFQINEDSREALAYIVVAVDRMSQVINGLMMLTGISRHNFHRERVNLSEISRVVFDELKQTEPNREVQLALPPELFINGDIRLIQILMENLIGNAWKFTSTRINARIEIGTFEKEESPCFFVRDNGIGFDIKDVGRIFHPYQRLHSAKEFTGSGIGLAIVKRIIDRHNGKIWAEGEKNKGATVYFALVNKELLKL